MTNQMERPWEDLVYPHIAHACFVIALDNGGINRDRSSQRWQRDYRRFIERQAAPLPEIDYWLGTLTEERLETVCAGEESEMLATMADAPPFTHDLLNTYFDEVC